MSSNLDRLGQELVRAALEVFEETGVVLEDSFRAQASVSSTDPMAVIGFGGDTVRGAVALEAPLSVIQASHPGQSSDTADLVDWLGELSNLLLARLKSKLRLASVAIQLGVPMTFAHATQASAASCPCVQYRLRAPGGWVLVSLAADVDRAFRFSPPVRVEAVEGIELF